MTRGNWLALQNVGFNLLPWRQRQMRRLLRRRLIEWCAAMLCGCAFVVPLVGWELWMRERTDARRMTVEQGAARLRVPVAEATRLASEAAAQNAAEQLAKSHAKPLEHLVTLFDALVSAGVTGVALTQLAQHGNEVDLEAAAVDETAASEWLGGLRSLPEVDSVNVRELKRPLAAGGAKAGTPGGKRIDKTAREPVHVVARLVWRGMPSATTPAGANRADKIRNPE
jgi:Tfp pilus assembly protein PilN